MLSKDYQRGFKAGHKAGVISGLHGSYAKELMARDLEYMYGAMCLVLKRKYGWEDDIIQSFCEEIQKGWDDMSKECFEKNIPVATLVYQETGVPLMQMTDYILADNNEDYVKEFINA